MKTFKASDLSHKRAEVMKAARDGGALIQEKRTNGEVVQEYVLITKTGEAIWSLYQDADKGGIDGVII